MMPPTIAIVGYSNTGKTRIATALIRNLAARGLRVAAVKHCHHRLQADPPGKDSAKLLAAGAARVIASSPGQVASVQQVEGDLLLDQVVALLDNSYDLIVAEGFKASTAPKVLVLGAEPMSPWPTGVIAVVSPHPVDPPTPVPVYSFEDVDRLAGQILKESYKGFS